MKVLAPSIELTFSTTNAWTDCDVSSYVPSGASCVFLHIICVTTTQSGYYFGLRKKGSSESLNNRSILRNTHNYLVTAIDDNQKFQYYSELVTGSGTLRVFLHAYGESEITMLSSRVDKTPSGYSGWEEVDCSTTCPNAKGIIFNVVSETIRQNDLVGIAARGSGYNHCQAVGHATNSYHWAYQTAITGCNTDQKVSIYRVNSNSIIKCYVIGYITDDFVYYTGSDALEQSLNTTGSWTDLPNAIGTDAIFAIFNVTSSDYLNFDIKRKGSTEDAESYRRTLYKCQWFCSVCDSDRKMEGKIANTDINFYCTCYFTGELSITYFKSSNQNILIRTTKTLGY